MGCAYDARTNKHTAIKYYFIVVRPLQSLAMTNIGRGIYDCVLVTFIMLFKDLVAFFIYTYILNYLLQEQKYYLCKNIFNFIYLKLIYYYVHKYLKNYETK